MEADWTPAALPNFFALISNLLSLLAINR